MNQRMLKFGEAIRIVLVDKYCCFKGRASRSEYWWFALLGFIIGCVFTPLQLIFPTVYLVLMGSVSLGLILPSFGVLWRRFHDIGKSGKWLISIYALILVLIIIFVIGAETMAVKGGITFLGILGIVSYILILAVSIWMIVLLCKPSQPGPNKFGEEPYTEH